MNNPAKLRTFSRRQFIALTTGLICVPLFRSCAVEDRPITIGLHTWPGYEPTPLAQSMGWLNEELVKLVQTNSATESLQLLGQGKIDAAGLTLDEVLRGREAGIPLSVILVCDISAGADQFLVRPEIKTLADIKGRKIGVEKGALGALMLYQVLQASNLKPEDVTVVALTINQHVDAWKRGAIDAVVTYEPASVEITKMGGVRLFDSSMIPDLIVDVIAVRAEFLDKVYTNALQNLVAAHLKALKHLTVNADDAVYRLAPRLNVLPEHVMALFKGLVLPDLENNIRLLATANPALLKSAIIIADTMVKAGILHRPADLAGLLHPEYLPQSDQ